MHFARWRRLLMLIVLCGALVSEILPNPVLPHPVVEAGETPPAGASQYVALAPGRLADTRTPAFGFSRPTSKTFRVKVAGRLGVPLNATAVVVNVSIMSTAGAGGIAVRATGSTYQVEHDVLATGPGQSVTNLVHVKLAYGSIDLTPTVGMQFAVDLVGAYVPVTGTVTEGRFVSFSTSRRATTSKVVAPLTATSIDLAAAGVPAGAQAAMVTLTAEQSPKGTWVAFPRNKPGAWSLVLDAAGQTRSNQTIVPLEGGTSIKVFAQSGGRLTVDVVGYYTGAGVPDSIEGLFVPMHHLRRFDSRPSRTIAPMGPVQFEFSPGTTLQVAAVVANLYTFDSWDAGAIVTRAAGVNASPMPVATIRSPRQALATHFVARTSTRGIAIKSSAGAHMVVDVEGVFLGPRPTATIAAVKNRTIAPTPVVQVKWSDAAGTHIRSVEASTTNTSNDMTRIADKGIAAAFKGMSTLAKKGNTMLFGHRTSRGGMFRYMHTMRTGQTFSLKGADGRWYHYRIVRVGVTTPTFNNIASMSTPYPPVTAQLIACSKRDGSPTSLYYRLVVTGILVSVTG